MAMGVNSRFQQAPSRPLKTMLSIERGVGGGGAAKNLNEPYVIARKISYT